MKHCTQQVHSFMYRKKTFTMKKFIVLASVFMFAACGGIDVNLGDDASAECNGGAGGADGGSSATAGGTSACACECTNDSVDGTRLKAQWIVGEDGSRAQAASWTDTELNDTCYFQSLPNGETRCVPPAIPLNSYVDPGCTYPAIVLKNPCESAPKYARIDKVEYNVDVCTPSKVTGFTYVSFDTTNPVKGVANIFAFDGSGQCVPVGGVPIGNQWRIYMTFPIHDGSWFVKANEGVGF